MFLYMKKKLWIVNEYDLWLKYYVRKTGVYVNYRLFKQDFESCFLLKLLEMDDDEINFTTSLPH